ncbi:MAG: acetyl-CoA carboxylase biotin carboxyl carrier protein subunit [bacterium]|nr:acetyl-CoA carboxylase biotin carboxyl carrier protein subunit [bacterium]
METTQWEKFFVMVDDEEFVVELPVGDDVPIVARVGDSEIAVEFEPVAGSMLWMLRTPSEGMTLTLESDFSGLTAHAKGWSFDVRIENESARKLKSLINSNRQPEGEIPFRAPMPGMVQRFLKAVGDRIHVGEPIAILEAMKMENELRSTVAGTISQLVAQPGAPVDKGAVLAMIAVEAL